MAAASVKTPSVQHFSPGRSNEYDLTAGYVSPPNSSYSATPGPASPAPSNKLPVFTSLKNIKNDGLSTSPRSSKQRSIRPTLRNIDTKMSSSTTTTTTTTTIPATTTITTKRAEPRKERLHKRASSASSLPGSPGALADTQSQFATPYATYEEPFPDLSTTPTNSTPRIKPYLRSKISTGGKEDSEQGRIDLSKSVSENSVLTGLGIQDFGSRTTSETLQTGRRTPHTRTTSVGSQISTSSGSFRPTQPFMHPMRQLPNRPYTPPTDASSLNDEEAHESSDVVTDDDVQVTHFPRNTRSTSISSTPQLPAPTPLSQSHTAAELGIIPKLTTGNRSETNLSIKSSSNRSLKSKLGRSRTNTNRSIEYVHSPSSRTSVDKAFSFVSRRSDPDPQTRDERIRAARRKFEEKEAQKDRLAVKRRETENAKSSMKQERQRRKSEASETMNPTTGPMGKAKGRSKRDPGRIGEMQMQARRYDESRVVTALPPTHGEEPGKSEKTERYPQQRGGDDVKGGGWAKFSTWVQTRMLSCGDKRS